MTIVDCQVIVDEIGRARFAGGKPICIGGRELYGYIRPSTGEQFRRWVPSSEAPDTLHDYVEFGPVVPPDEPEVSSE